MQGWVGKDGEIWRLNESLGGRYTLQVGNSCERASGVCGG